MNKGRFEGSARSLKPADHQWHARGQGFKSPQLHANPHRWCGFDDCDLMEITRAGEPELCVDRWERLGRPATDKFPARSG